jgi:hypothetical protein
VNKSVLHPILNERGMVQSDDHSAFEALRLCCLTGGVRGIPGCVGGRDPAEGPVDACGAYCGVGACYTVRYPDWAFERIKNGILRYDAAVGTENSETSGYHETLTRLWARTWWRSSWMAPDP